MFTKQSFQLQVQVEFGASSRFANLELRTWSWLALHSLETTLLSSTIWTNQCICLRFSFKPIRIYLNQNRKFFIFALSRNFVLWITNYFCILLSYCFKVMIRFFVSRAFVSAPSIYTSLPMLFFTRTFS